MDTSEPPRPTNDRRARRAIVLTSHPANAAGGAPKIRWGAADPNDRGPVIGTLTNHAARNAIGTHAGAYSLYRALAIAAGQLDAAHRPDLTDTAPAVPLGPFPQWSDPERIVSLDPWGHLVGAGLRDRARRGLGHPADHRGDQAHINMPEICPRDRTPAGSSPTAQCSPKRRCPRSPKSPSTRSGICPASPSASASRRPTCAARLFEHTGGMFPELVTRPDLEVFLPPIGGMTVYLFGDLARSPTPQRPSPAACTTSATAPTCSAPTSAPAAPTSRTASRSASRPRSEGGVGVIVYNRKEGRALGEVTKFLVYNARKRQDGGDRAETYFERTECVAGVPGHALPGADARCAALARHHADRPLRVDEQHEIRRHRRPAASR